MVNAVLHARTLTLRMTLRRARARVNARPIQDRRRRGAIDD